MRTDDDRQYEEEDKEATKEFVSDDDLTEEGFDGPFAIQNVVKQVKMMI